jgi:hypothetical protein
MHLNPVAYSVKVFGGTCKLARAIGVARWTVSKWKQPAGVWRYGEGDLPSTEVQRKILQAAKDQNLDLTAEDLINGREIAEPVAAV